MLELLRRYQVPAIEAVGENKDVMVVVLAIVDGEAAVVVAAAAVVVGSDDDILCPLTCLAVS